MSNGMVFLTLLDRFHSIPAWAHFTPQNADGSWWSGRLKFPKLIKVNKFDTHSHCLRELFIDIYLIDPNFQLFHVMRENWRVCKPGELTHREFGTTSPQFPRKSDLNFFGEERQSRTGQTMADHFVYSPASCTCNFGRAKFTSWGTRAKIIPGRNDKWNGKFLEFPNFQK